MNLVWSGLMRLGKIASNVHGKTLEKSYEVVHFDNKLLLGLKYLRGCPALLCGNLIVQMKSVFLFNRVNQFSVILQHNQQMFK